MTTPPVVLSIAGSDPSAGAGIQADLKAFAAHGVYGLTAVTAITAQNTHGVQQTAPVDAALVTAQIAVLAEDFPIAAVKTGMLATAAVVEAVAEAVARFALPNLIVDPITTAASGAALLDADGVRALCARLLPLATLVTPNWVEAEALTGIRIVSPMDARLAGAALRDQGARAVLVTGGHAPGHEIVDVLVEADGVSEFRATRVRGRATHGTGCAYTAALAAGLALGRPLQDAVPLAQGFVAESIARGFDLGTGPHGPMHHLHGWH